MMFHRIDAWILQALKAMALLRTPSLTTKAVDILHGPPDAKLANRPHARSRTPLEAAIWTTSDIADPDTLERLLRGAVAECADIDLLLEDADRFARSRLGHLAMGGRELTA